MSIGVALEGVSWGCTLSNCAVAEQSSGAGSGVGIALRSPTEAVWQPVCKVCLTPLTLSFRGSLCLWPGALSMAAT